MEVKYVKHDEIYYLNFSNFGFDILPVNDITDRLSYGCEEGIYKKIDDIFKTASKPKNGTCDQFNVEFKKEDFSHVEEVIDYVKNKAIETKENEIIEKRFYHGEYRIY